MPGSFLQASSLLRMLVSLLWGLWVVRDPLLSGSLHQGMVSLGLADGVSAVVLSKFSGESTQGQCCFNMV